MVNPVHVFGSRLVAAFMLLSVVAVAAPITPSEGAGSSSSLSASAGQPSEAKVYGLFELRPSYTSKAGEFHTENTIEGGYQFNKNVRLTYTQWFTTNLYNPAGGNQTGLNLKADEGFVRLKVNNFWVSDDKSTQLSFQARLFVPTKASKRDAGLIVAPRAYLKLAHDFSKFLSMDIQEAVKFHGYDRAGFNGKANPIFENMVVLNADLHVAKNVTVSLPFYFVNTRMREFGAVQGTWAHQLIFWPEIDWDITKNHTVGLAFYTDSLITPNFGSSIGDGFKNGVTQLIYTLTL